MTVSWGTEDRENLVKCNVGKFSSDAIQKILCEVYGIEYIVNCHKYMSMSGSLISLHKKNVNSN